MSTAAEFADLEAFEDAISRLRTDTENTTRRAWVLAGHVSNKPNLVQLVAEGEDLGALTARLDDDQVMYALLRLTTSFDMSTTVKFVYVHWVGEHVKPMVKGRIGVVHGSVQERFKPAHLDLEISSIEDLDEKTIINKLDDSSGTRSKVLEGSVAGRQMRGFTQHSVQKQDKGQLRSVAPAGVAVHVTDDLNQAIGAVRDDTSATQWVVGGYEAASVKRPLTLVAAGEGGIEEMKAVLDDSQVMYGLFRTRDTIDDIPTVKFVYIYWVGDQVKPLTKGQVSALAGPVEKVFSPVHVCLSFTNRYDISDAVVRDKVTASSGSKSFVK